MKKKFKEFFKEVDDTIDYDPEQLKKGIEAEKEHTTDEDLAEVIAKHHLAEIDDYYDELDKMEKKAKKKNK